MIAFELECPPNFSNERTHWGVRSRWSVKVRKEIFITLAGTGGLPTTAQRLEMAKRPRKCLVSFTRFYGGRRQAMDNDGVASACKPVLDALKLVMSKRRDKATGIMVEQNGAGLIFDDRPEWCAVAYEQKKDPTRAGMLRVEVS